MFIAALFIFPQQYKQFKCPSINTQAKYFHTGRYFHTVEHYLTIRRNEVLGQGVQLSGREGKKKKEVLTHAITTQMKPKNIMLRKEARYLNSFLAGQFVCLLFVCCVLCFVCCVCALCCVAFWLVCVFVVCVLCAGAHSRASCTLGSTLLLSYIPSPLDILEDHIL